MKKLLLGLTLATVIGAANATPSTMLVGGMLPQTTIHHTYDYHKGKSDAYNNVARTLFVVGAVAVVGIIIYELGQDSNSRWGVSENGLTYAF